MIIIAPFLTRRNHRFYIIDNGELVPVEFEGGMRGGMVPPPGMMGPYGQAPFPGQQPPPSPGYFNRPPPPAYPNQQPPGYQPYGNYQTPPPPGQYNYRPQQYPNYPPPSQ